MATYRGKVTKIDSDFVWVEIPDLAIDQEFPCQWINGVSAGDLVVVVNVTGAQEDLIIMGKVGGVSSSFEGIGIQIDTDGVPYYDPAAPGAGVPVKIDTDGVPYY